MKSCKKKTYHHFVKVRAKVGDEDDWFELNRGWTNKFATKKGDPLYSTEKKCNSCCYCCLFHLFKTNQINWKLLLKQMF